MKSSSWRKDQARSKIRKDLNDKNGTSKTKKQEIQQAPSSLAKRKDRGRKAASCRFWPEEQGRGLESKLPPKQIRKAGKKSYRTYNTSGRAYKAAASKQDELTRIGKRNRKDRGHPYDYSQGYIEQKA